MDTQVADSLLGSLVDGRYRIRGRVARGGMATVYLATDERLERTVALKIIHSARTTATQAQPAGFPERFTDEAKNVARLTHPNVVAVYDQGTYRGWPYLVMEYVRGRTLRDILTERHRLNPDEALAILEQMLAAIAAAHRAGLVHRDVKPENVLIAEAPSGGSEDLVDSVVKVADFGLAQAVEASTAVDAGGQLMATVAYVAPELVTEGRADPRTDVYAAGIILFEMLTGRVPYDGDQPVKVAWQHVDCDVPAPSTVVPDLPAALDNLVVRATQRDPAFRPTDAGALLPEVQATRENLGNANVHTTVLRPVSEPTMVVPPVQPVERPSWARLPDQKSKPQPHRRRAASPAESVSLAQRLQEIRARVMGDRRSRTAVAATIVVLGLVAALGGWWFGVGRYTDTPALVSLSKAEAEAKAAQGGFAIRYVDARHDETIAKDVVLAQDPTGGTRILKDGTITLTLSLGPERYQVPDVVGKNFDLAVADLEKAKLKVKRAADRFNDNLPAGLVISVNPAVGEEVKPGDEVTVTVSKGKAPITVPNLVGKSLAEARTLLEQLGLSARVSYKADNRPKDQVIGQNPADGAGAEHGAHIDLEVSEGPPLVTVPRVIGLPCQQAKQTLESQQFTVQIHLNPNGTVHAQNPGENSTVPPGSQVVLWCY